MSLDLSHSGYQPLAPAHLSSESIRVQVDLQENVVEIKNFNRHLEDKADRDKSMKILDFLITFINFLPVCYFPCRKCCQL